MEEKGSGWWNERGWGSRWGVDQSWLAGCVVVTRAGEARVPRWMEKSTEEREGTGCVRAEL